jgi:hypothetical protein
MAEITQQARKAELQHPTIMSFHLVFLRGIRSREWAGFRMLWVRHGESGPQHRQKGVFGAKRMWMIQSSDGIEPSVRPVALASPRWLGVALGMPVL